MKKLLPVLFAIIAVPVSAQQGAWYAGGNVGYFTTSEKSSDTLNSVQNKYTNWIFAPDAGIYLSNYLQVGAGISINGAKSTLTDVSGHTTSDKSMSYGGMVLARYFFTTTALRPFAGLNLDISAGNYETEGYPDKAKTFSVSGALTGGFAYSFTQRFSALASITGLRFNHSESKADDGSGRKEEINTFGLWGNTNASTFNLGVQYVMLKRKPIKEQPVPVGD